LFLFLNITQIKLLTFSTSGAIIWTNVIYSTDAEVTECYSGDLEVAPVAPVTFSLHPIQMAAMSNVFNAPGNVSSPGLEFR